MAEEKKSGGIGLTTQIFLGLILGVIFGYLFPSYGEQLKPIGDIFIRMIKMIVVPLIFSSLIMGIAGTGDFKKLGRLGAKSILWFELATTVALFVGLLVVNVFEPGVGVQIVFGDRGVHGLTTFSSGAASPASTALKRARARDRRDITVPWGMLSAAATSA